MLLLLFFDRTTGPAVLMTDPPNIDSFLPPHIQDQIKNLMDIAGHGFFLHSFDDTNTANYYTTFESDWARGKEEFVMLTYVIPGEPGDRDWYKQEMIRFMQQIREMPEIYKAFYKNNPFENGEPGEIDLQFRLLETAFRDFSRRFRVYRLMTRGELMPATYLIQNRAVPLDDLMVHELKSVQGPYTFAIYRKQRDSFQIQLIPYDQSTIVKISVIFYSDVTPEFLNKFRGIVEEHQIVVIFSGGVCQAAERCVYESYIRPNPAGIAALEAELEGLSSVEGVLVDILEVERSEGLRMLHGSRFD
jgi:hypothetical protein